MRACAGNLPHTNGRGRVLSAAYGLRVAAYLSLHNVHVSLLSINTMGASSQFENHVSHNTPSGIVLLDLQVARRAMHYSAANHVSSA